MSVNILDLPDNIFDEIVSNSSFEEISKMRGLSKKFDSAGKRILSQGPRAVLEFIDYFLQPDEESNNTPIAELISSISENYYDMLTPLLESHKALYGVIESIVHKTRMKCCGIYLGQVLDETFSVFWDIELCRRAEPDISAEKVDSFRQGLELSLFNIANFVYIHRNYTVPINLAGFFPRNLIFFPNMYADMVPQDDDDDDDPPVPSATPDELQEQIERMTRQNNENKIKIDGLAQTVSELKQEFKNSAKKLEELRTRFFKLENKIIKDVQSLESTSGEESFDISLPSTSGQSQPPTVIPEPSDDTQFPPNESSDESHVFELVGEPTPTTSTHQDHEIFVRPKDFSGFLPPRKKSKISSVRKSKKLLHLR